MQQQQQQQQQHPHPHGAGPDGRRSYVPSGLALYPGTVRTTAALVIGVPFLVILLFSLV